MPEDRKPLKRHPALQPLSRDHHQGLILAQLLKQDTPDYKGLPTTTEGKIDYAHAHFHRDLEPHFLREEEQLIPRVCGYSVELDKLCGVIREEHDAIRAAIDEIRSASEGEALALLDALGRLLEAHIRREERMWFPLIQETVPEDVLTDLNLQE